MRRRRACLRARAKAWAQLPRDGRGAAARSTLSRYGTCMVYGMAWIFTPRIILQYFRFIYTRVDVRRFTRSPDETSSHRVARRLRPSPTAVLYKYVRALVHGGGAHRSGSPRDATVHLHGSGALPPAHYLRAAMHAISVAVRATLLGHPSSFPPRWFAKARSEKAHPNGSCRRGCYLFITPASMRALRPLRPR